MIYLGALDYIKAEKINAHELTLMWFKKQQKI